MPAPLTRHVETASLARRAVAFNRFGASAALLDGAGIIVDTNESWRLFSHLNDGDPATTSTGVDYLAVCDRATALGVEGAGRVARELRQILAGERQRMDFKYPCPSPAEDRCFLLQASGAPIVDGAGIVVFHIDVTARKLLADRLGTIADHDELTGFPNRRSAVKYLDEQLALAAVTPGSVWVHFIELNTLNDVKDRHGHNIGDELSCKIALCARRVLRAEDQLFRFETGEIVLICAGLDRPGAVELAARLRRVMAAPFQVGEVEVMGTVSVGFTESRPSSTADSLFRDAAREMHIDRQHAPSMTTPSAGARFRRGGRDTPDGVVRPGAEADRERIANGRRLEVLARAQRVISSLDFDASQIAVRVADWAQSLSQADCVTVEVRDGEDLVCQAARGVPGVEIGARRTAQGSLAAACMESELPALWTDGVGPGEPVADCRSGVVMPLMATDGGAALGVLTVASTRQSAFSDHDILGLEVIAGIAGGFIAKAELLVVLERTAARYRTLVDHLPGTAVIVFDQQLCLLLVAGPGARLWRYAERNVEPGHFLQDIVTSAELAILEPFYRAAFVEPGTLEYHSGDTGLDFHFAAVPIANLDGEVDQLLVTVTNVTQLKANEEALREAENRYRTAFEEGPVGMART